MKSLILILFFIHCGVIGDKNSQKEKTNLRNLVLLGVSLRSPSSTEFNWNLPPGFPTPNVPAENPMSDAKVELGRFLFYDSKLSQNQTMSCSTCHLQNLAFTDAKSVPLGSTGEAHPRNSQNLANVVYNSRLTWANNKLISLEQQMRVPLFGETPIELGLSNNDYIARLNSDSRYRELFSKAYGGGTEKINEQGVIFAIASFQRSLISGRSPFDKYTYDKNRMAISSSAIRGSEIFNGEVAECFHCHGGVNFTDSISHQGASANIVYSNNGIKSQATYNSLPIEKRGLYEVTGNINDDGKFKAPSLRNIALTFPYMHDGSFTCTVASPSNLEACSTEALGKVIDHYMSGGQPHPTKDTSFIRPFSLTPGEKTDLINFMKSLTDEEFIKNTKHSNPFQ